jgi:hypothetical protein
VRGTRLASDVFAMGIPERSMDLNDFSRFLVELTGWYSLVNPGGTYDILMCHAMVPGGGGLPKRLNLLPEAAKHFPPLPDPQGHVLEGLREREERRREREREAAAGEDGRGNGLQHHMGGCAAFSSHSTSCS